MNHREEYNRKLVTADAAVRVVKPGDWVDYGHFTCAPTYLDAALAGRAHELNNVKVRALTFPGMAAIATADPDQEHFIYNNWHFSGGDRKLHDKDQPDKTQTGYIVCRCARPMELHENVLAVPYWAI